jgi:hypothetical protein
MAGEYDVDPVVAKENWRPHLRELLWLKEKERAKECARCQKKKHYILNLAYRDVRFGICRSCLETLWGELRDDY